MEKSDVKKKSGAGRENAPAEYFDTNQAASYTRLSPKYLEALRYLEGGPIFSRVGVRIIYSRARLDEWLRSHETTSTSDGRRRPANGRPAA